MEIVMNWFYRFMSGRYGMDPLNVALVVVAMAITLISSMFGVSWVGMVSWILLVLAVFRMFSRNVVKRREENLKFTQIWNKSKSRIKMQGRKVSDRKTHRHFKCRQCGAELRVPKGKGVIVITCPVCKTEIKART